MLARIWAFPNTLLGLLLVLIWRARFLYEINGARVYTGLRWGSYIGLTLGEVIIFKSEAHARAPWFEAHEYAHVKQYRRWGPIFLPAYAIASLIGKIKTGTWYHGNAFEIAAQLEEYRTREDFE